MAGEVPWKDLTRAQVSKRAQEASGSQWSLAQQSRNPFKDVFVVVKKDKHANIGVRCPSPNSNVENHSERND